MSSLTVQHFLHTSGMTTASVVSNSLCVENKQFSIVYLTYFIKLESRISRSMVNNSIGIMVGWTH